MAEERDIKRRPEGERSERCNPKEHNKEDKQREEKMCKKVRKRQKDKFSKTRCLVGDRIRMCRMKRLGRRQQFWKASASICANI